MIEGLQNFQTKPLAEQVADNIIQYIIDQNLQEGDKIPNEFVLAESLGVGRSTVREAIKLLVSRNVVAIRRGAGTFIAGDTGIAEDPLGLSFIKNKNQLAMDLVNVRLMLEPEIAALAARNASDDQIAELKEQCGTVERLIKAGENHTLEDIRFHKLIAACSGNMVVEKLIPIINTSIAVFMDVTKRQLLEETVVTHREIMEAIAEHDEAGAKHAMNMHLTYNWRAIRNLLRRCTE